MLRNLLNCYCLLFIFLGSSPLFAQRFEAENATLTEGGRKVANENASGGYHVALEFGSHLAKDHES